MTRRAMLSVFDKQDVDVLARGLLNLGFEIVSTGGTATFLESQGIPVTSVADVTQFPEMLDGRVKTLHPAIHAGLLAKQGDTAHRQALVSQGIAPFHLLAVNLYPFEATVKREGTTFEEAIEQIDIGGPAMIRSAAKNHADILVLTDPVDYATGLEHVANGQPDLSLHRRLAAKAFGHTAAYDALVADYLLHSDVTRVEFPDQITFAGRKVADLRYGENPQQTAASYRRLGIGVAEPGVLDSRQLGGKPLSFNNLLDADAAWAAVRDLDQAAVAIIKHTLPCGLAIRESAAAAFEAALAGDPVSAYGGIVASNTAISLEMAKAILPVFFEVVIAPDFAAEAIDVLGSKAQLRLLVMPVNVDSEYRSDLLIQPIQGGMLVQTADRSSPEVSTWRTVSTAQPSHAQLRDLQLAWHASRLVKSNAIVLVAGNAVVGVGGGQPNRLQSIDIALRTAGVWAAGSVLASDGFLPFADNVEMAAAAGIQAIVQPGGSIRDQEVIVRADELGLVMMLTDRRHFLH